MRDMIVMKFGGTSVGSAQGIKEVARLVSADPIAHTTATSSQRIVVLSAMAGVTNTLVSISTHYRNGNIQGAKQEIESLKTRFFSTIDELYTNKEYCESARLFVEEKIGYLHEFAEDIFTDFEEKIVLAQGELISVEMMRLYLTEQGTPAVHLPALDFMSTDKYEEPAMEQIKQELEHLLIRTPGQKLFITEGYICRNAYTEIDNLKRGGSDYTATLIGSVLNADEIQIWTDIDGLHNNDPRIVKETQPVRSLYFDQAAELAYFGAKILHPTCILPAKLQNIPVRILNTRTPDLPGTIVSNVIDEGDIKAIAAKDGITAIKIVSSRKLLSYGFLRKIFEVFERHRTTVDMVTTSEVAVSVTIDNPSRLQEIISELSKYGSVSVDKEMTTICIAGDLNWKNIGFEAKIIKALHEIPVRMISYGGSNYNVSVLIRSKDKQEALEALSKHLF